MPQKVIIEKELLKGIPDLVTSSTAIPEESSPEIIKEDISIIGLREDQVLVTIHIDPGMKEKAEAQLKLCVNDDQKNEVMVNLSKGKLKSKLLMRCDVIMVGPKVLDERIKVGSIVYVFGNNFIADISTDDIKYFAYNERNIVFVVNPQTK